MSAFDYDKQEWVEGERAYAVRLGQLESELALLKSERAAEYLRFNGSSDTVEQALAECEAEIVRLMTLANR